MQPKLLKVVLLQDVAPRPQLPGRHQVFEGQQFQVVTLEQQQPAPGPGLELDSFVQVHLPREQP